MVLLDTCAVIWLANGDTMSREARSRIEEAAVGGGVLVSPITAWEIGLLARRDSELFAPDPTRWFERFLTGPGTKPAPCTAAIMIHSASLPDWQHRDPADRMIVATARKVGVPIVTRDQRFLDYARAGHVEVIAC